MIWVPPKGTGKFTLTMIGPMIERSDGYGTNQTTTLVANGQTRQEAATLAGILLNCSIYAQAVLQEEMTTGHYESDPEETTGEINEDV